MDYLLFYFLLLQILHEVQVLVPGVANHLGDLVPHQVALPWHPQVQHSHGRADISVRIQPRGHLTCVKERWHPMVKPGQDSITFSGQNCITEDLTIQNLLKF